MSDYEATHNAIRTRFYTSVSSIDPETQVAWPNANFETGNSITTWVRFNILDGQSYQASMGAASNMHRHPGLVVVNIFSPLLRGDQTALRLADEIAGIFRNYQDSSLRLRFFSPELERIGPEDKWYQVNVSIPFERDSPF